MRFSKIICTQVDMWIKRTDTCAPKYTTITLLHIAQKDCMRATVQSRQKKNQVLDSANVNAI